VTRRPLPGFRRSQRVDESGLIFGGLRLVETLRHSSGKVRDNQTCRTDPSRAVRRVRRPLLTAATMTFSAIAAGFTASRLAGPGLERALRRDPVEMIHVQVWRSFSPPSCRQIIRWLS
jgi:hypothetical protein